MGDGTGGDSWRRCLPDLADAVTRKAVSFDQLVEAYSGRLNAGHRGMQDQYAAAYPEVRSAFQEAHGELVSIEYRTETNDSAVALTTRTDSRRRPWYKPWMQTAYRRCCVHLRFPPSRFADLLDLQHKCQYFQIQQYRVNEQRYVEPYAQALYAVSCAVLQLDEPHDGKPSPPLTTAAATITEMQGRYDWIQSRMARFDYMRGVGIGVGAIAFALLLLLLLAAGLRWPSQVTTVFLSMAGGATAAGSNAMLRLVQGTPTVQGDESHLLLAFFGALRPALGAIFALIAYALIQGGLVPVKVPTPTETLFWFVIGISFVAGFSENFAPDLVRKASTQMGAADRPPSQ